MHLDPDAGLVHGLFQNWHRTAIVKVADLPNASTTIQTRVPDHPALDAYGTLFGKVERKLHAAFEAGRGWRGDLQTSFYQPFGISSQHLDHVRTSLLGKLDAVSARSRVQANTLRDKAKAKRKQAATKDKAIAKTRAAIVKAGAKRDAALAAIAKAEPDLASIRSTIAVRAEKRIAAARDKLADADLAIAKGRATIERLEFENHQHKRRAGTLDE